MRDHDGPNIFGSTLSTSGNAATIQFWDFLSRSLTTASFKTILIHSGYEGSDLSAAAT
jgi:hypothetical protein